MSILSWSIMPKDKTPYFYFFQRSGSELPFLPLCRDAHISSVSYEDVYLLITFAASDINGFIFTIVFPANEVRYSHDVIRDHLTGKCDPAMVDHIVSNFLDLSSPKAFVRSYQNYTGNIFSAISEFEKAKAKGKAPVRRVGSVSLQAGSNSGTARSGLATPEASQAAPTRKRANTNPSSSGSKKSKKNPPGSTVTFMNPTMKAATCEKDINYEDAKKTLADYWEKCADCYILGVDAAPVDVDIDLLDTSEPRFVVRALEPSGIKHYKNILTNQIDVSSRPTIVIMPKITVPPLRWDWNTLSQSCRFRLIDGQHHIVAAKELIADKKVSAKKITALQTWKAHVVWHSDANKIMDVSAMANKTNNAGTFTPSWATNIMGARNVWKDYGCPKKLKVPKGRESEEHFTLRMKYEVCHE